MSRVELRWLALASCLFLSCGGGGGGGGTPAAAPVITTQPQAVVTLPGRAAGLSVTATGAGPLTYQWFRDGNPLAGATSAACPIASPQASDSGVYSVTVSNAGGATPSLPTVFTVSPASAGPAYETVPAVTVSGAKLPVQLIFDSWPDTTAVQLTRPDNSVLPLVRIPDTNKWVLTLPESEVLKGYSSGFAFALGTMSATSATHPYSDYVLQGIRTADMPDVAIIRRAATVQESPHLVNIQYDNLYTVTDSYPNVLQIFYQYFNDDFDFMVQSWLARESYYTHYRTIRNSVTGTGVPLQNRGAELGIPNTSRIRGMVNFSPNGPFDLAQQVLAHEIGHSTMNAIREVALSTITGHFPLSTAAFGIMGTSGVNTRVKLTKLSNGNYQVDLATPYLDFNEYELYMMGLIPSSQVPDQVVFTGQTPPNLLPGTVLTGPGARVTIAQVIAANGPRNPTYPNALTTLRVATLILSRGRMLSAQEMALYDYMAARGEAKVPMDSGYARPWYVCTGGRSTLSTAIHP